MWLSLKNNNNNNLLQQNVFGDIPRHYRYVWLCCLNNNFCCLNNITFFYPRIFPQHLNNVTKIILPNGPYLAPMTFQERAFLVYMDFYQLYLKKKNWEINSLHHNT